MARVAAIGERFRVQGFALAGAAVHAAEDAPAVLAAWDALPADVAVVVLTPAAARALTGDRLAGDRLAGDRLTVVMPS
jgi:vacuolar-type H+-ATPase subunit F/Vma7